MKIEEMIPGPSGATRACHVISKIFDVPMDDCTPEEISRIGDLLGDICNQEDNAEIILSMVTDTVKKSINEAVIRNQRVTMTTPLQLILMQGFVLGYFYKAAEARKGNPVVQKLDDHKIVNCANCKSLHVECEPYKEEYLEPCNFFDPKDEK